VMIRVPPAMVYSVASFFTLEVWWWTCPNWDLGGVCDKDKGKDNQQFIL